MKHLTRTGLPCRYILTVLMIYLVVIPVAAVAKAASSQVKPGNYCPDTNILLIVAEDLSSTLEFVMQSRVAQTRNDQAIMLTMLDAAGITLKQATGRGAGARTAQLINSTVLSRVNESNDQLLTWFPLLHSALLTLPADATASAADDAIGRAEEILQGSQNADPLNELRKARHFLTCDDLNLPLQAAIREQQRLISKIRQHKPVAMKDYDKIINSLRTAMAYVLDHSQT